MHEVILVVIEGLQDDGVHGFGRFPLMGIWGWKRRASGPHGLPGSRMALQEGKDSANSWPVMRSNLGGFGARQVWIETVWRVGYWDSKLELE